MKHIFVSIFRRTNLKTFCNQNGRTLCNNSATGKSQSTVENRQKLASLYSLSNKILISKCGTLLEVVYVFPYLTDLKRMTSTKIQFSHTVNSNVPF